MNRPLFHHGSSRHGLVLIEVIAALTIFAMIAFSLVSALDATVDAAKSRNEVDMAVRGLGNQLALLHSGPIVMGEKDVPDDNSGISYHISIVPQEMRDQKGQAITGICRLTITAEWKSGRDTLNRSITALVNQQQ